MRIPLGRSPSASPTPYATRTDSFSGQLRRNRLSLATVISHMGRQQLYLDSAALCCVADCFDTTAVAIDSAARVRLGGLVFDGSVAGRDHVGSGEALRRALDGWAPELSRWSRASTEIAAALRAGAVRYGNAESSAADRVG